MNTLSFALKNLSSRWFRNSIQVIVLSIGISLLIAVQVFNQQVSDRLSKGLNQIQVVVGAKGSPLQIILASVFHIDQPTGNIPFREFEALQKNPSVAVAVPLSMGDNVAGFRIVGTNSAYQQLYHLMLSQGKWWQHPMQAVIGDQVARATGLQIGDKFYSMHGLTQTGDIHKLDPYIVTGILQPSFSSSDDLVLTDTASVWQVHSHPDADEPAPAEKMVTSVLLSLNNPLANLTLPREINKTPFLTAASPANEINRLYLMFGYLIKAARFLGLTFTIAAAIAFFGFIYQSIQDRQPHIRAMRVIGGSYRKIFQVFLVESIILCLISDALGLLMGHGMIASLNFAIQSGAVQLFDPLRFSGSEWLLIVLTLGITIIATLLCSLANLRSET